MKQGRTDAEKVDAMALAIMVKCDGYGRITRGRIMREAKVNHYDFDRLITHVPFVVSRRAPGWIAVIEKAAHTTASGKKVDTVWNFTSDRQPSPTRRALGRLRCGITKKNRALPELNVADPAGPAMQALIDELIAEKKQDIKLAKLIDKAGAEIV